MSLRFNVNLIKDHIAQMAIGLAYYLAFVFVLPFTNANFTDVCNETYSNTQGLQCFPCSPGYTKKDDCVTNQTRAQCKQCHEGTYQPHCLSADETGVCRNCTLCDVYKHNCTIYQNAVCGGSDNIKEGTSERSGFTVLIFTLIWFFLVLVISFAFVFCQQRYRQRWKQDAKNKRNNGPGNIKRDDRRDIEYKRNSITKKFAWSSTENIQCYRKNIDSSIDKIPKVESLFGDYDRKNDLRGSSKDVQFDGSSPKRSITDKSKVTEDVPKGKTNKLFEESKNIAVISPIQWVAVNKHHSLEGNVYRGDQVIQERLQTSGDSENTPKENTNNKESNNNQSSPSLDENQIIQVTEPAGSEERGVITEINWKKLFTKLIPHLPIDDASWTFFADELLGNSQEVSGFPENVTNERSTLKGNKETRLAYLDLLERWHNIMASDASLEHIKEALKTFKNQIVMEEFAKIEQNPPTRKKVDQNTKTSIIPWRPNEQFPPIQRQVITYAQHESTNEIAETHGLLSHRVDGQIVEYTNTRASKCQTSQFVQPGPSRLALQHVKQREDKKLYKSRSYHDRWLRSQLKKKVKKEVKKAEQKRKMEDESTFLKNENIALIKIILPLDNDQLNRQRYDTFLEYTVNKIMEHNRVARETVLSITCKEYTDYTKKADTNNGGRHILHSGNQKLMLDKEQYDCLVLYEKFARTKVLKDIEGLEDSGDITFLFITYDGEQYQKHSFESDNSSCSTSSSSETESSAILKHSFESDNSSCSTGSSSSEIDSSDVNDMERGESHRCRISTRSASSTMFDQPANFKFKNESIVSMQQKSLISGGSAPTSKNDNPVDVRVKPYQLPAISENNTSLNNENMVPIQENNADSTKSRRKRKHYQKINSNHDNEGKKRCFEVEHEMPPVCIPDEENVNQEISVSTHVANINNGMQENDSDTSIEDLIKDNDKETATS